MASDINRVYRNTWLSRYPFITTTPESGGTESLVVPYILVPVGTIQLCMHVFFILQNSLSTAIHFFQTYSNSMGYYRFHRPISKCLKLFHSYEHYFSSDVLKFIKQILMKKQQQSGNKQQYVSGT